MTSEIERHAVEALITGLGADVRVYEAATWDVFQQAFADDSDRASDRPDLPQPVQ